MNIAAFRRVRWKKRRYGYMDIHSKPRIGIEVVAMKRNIKDLSDCDMKKIFSCNPRSYILPILFFFFISGPVQVRVSVAQENASPIPGKKQVIHPEVQRIPATELRDLLAKKADIVVIDVNPKDFFDSWHIPSAINIPYSSLDGGASRERKLKKIPVGKLIVLYCLCEEGADSSEEALELRRLGHAWKNVKVLEGGLTQWDEKGYPMYKQKMTD